jgi:hypothetical protein
MPEENVDRAADFKQLRWSLQALAAAGSSQPNLFPDHARKAGELAVDFDRCASLVRAEYERELTRARVDALAAVADKLAVIARDGAEFEVDLWTDEALTSSEHWTDVRRLAAAALEAFGWGVESSPSDPEDLSKMFAR